MSPDDLARPDVAVVGLGAMGSATLWRLAARGISCISFDRFDPPHDRGSSHGESRIIRTAYFEGPEYVPLVQVAFRLWRELEHESGTSLLTQTGALMIGRPDAEVVAGTLLSAGEHNLPHEILEADAMSKRYPQHWLGVDEIAVYEEVAGFLRPEEAVKAALGRAGSLGAQVYRSTPVTRVEAGDDGVHITTRDTTFQVRHAVISVGPWLADLLPGLELPLRVERQVQAWFPVGRPADFAPSVFPVFMHELTGGRFRYGIPTLDGKSIKLAVHHEGSATTARDVDREVVPADLEPLQAFIRQYLVGVTPEATRSEVCMYTNTPDDHFLVGAPSGMGGITVLGGCSGHSFKFAPVIGDAAADLVTRGTTAYPIETFALDRFS
jgi:sarcosine oxidase